MRKKRAKAIRDLAVKTGNIGLYRTMKRFYTNSRRPKWAAFKAIQVLVKKESSGLSKLF
jgi:hypothetical protein